MNNRKRNYIFLSVIIAAEFLAVRILNDFGITIASELVKAIGGIIFYLPIVGFLFYLSNDPRLKKHWKIVLWILIAYIVFAFVIGTILSIFVKA